MTKEEILEEISKYNYFCDARVVLLTNGWDDETYSEDSYDDVVGKKKFKIIETMDEKLIVLAIKHPYIKNKSQRIYYKNGD